MKKTAILLVALLLSSPGETFSQIPLNLKLRHRIEGDTITLTSVIRSRGFLTVQTATDSTTGKSDNILYTDLRYYEIIPGSIESLWQMKILESGVYENLLKSGYSYETRYAMEEMMKEYLGKAEQNNAFYIDSYLEARLYALLRMVYPVRHPDRRPGVLSLRILSDITPDAWVGPEGTLIITTGMITALNSETELMALMAQEVAHFALDHHLTSYTNTLSSGIDPALGNIIRYTIQQELAADRCAVAVLEAYGKSSAALGSMLSNVLASGKLMGNYYLETSRGSFPDASKRAASNPGMAPYKSAEYDKLIAPVISYNAFSAYNQSQFLLCRWLLNRNIASGMASPDDLVLLSQAMMNLSGSAEEDEKALEVIHSVIADLQEPSPGAFKQEALLLLRLGRRGEAETALDRCDEALDREEQKYRSMTGDWSQILSYLASEKEWVDRTRSR